MSNAGMPRWICSVVLFLFLFFPLRLNAADPQADVIERVNKREYYVSWQDRTYLKDLLAAYQAPNRAHGFRTYFTADGVRIIPRDEESPSWELGLTLLRTGRVGAMNPVTRPIQSTEKNRIEYHRGPITEWYINEERGLEQGFTIAAPPAGSGMLVVEMALSGPLQPAFSSDRQAITFSSPEGGLSVLHYSQLHVFDSGGRQLPAWFGGPTDAAIRGIAILVDDTGADYPIVVDPIIAGPLLESNQDNAEFGVSVATAGDVNGDGYSDLIVGARFYDNGQTNEGAAFLYYGSASGLNMTPLMLESNQASARFGFSVATAGDLNGDSYSDIVVGADLYDNGQADEGAAFVYFGSASGLNTTPVVLEVNQADARFGCSVSTAGDINGNGFSEIVVGARLYDNVQTDEGAVFVFRGIASGVNTTPQVLERNQSDARFGTSVSTAGDINGDGYSDIIAGASLFDSGQTDEGAAFVYTGSGSGLNTTPVVLQSDQANAAFGGSVSTAGDVNGDGYADVIVGAALYDNGEADEGAAFVYYGSGSGFGAPLILDNDQASASFGTSVAVAGDVNGDGYSDVVVGASLFDSWETDAGAAFLYSGSIFGLNPSPHVVLQGNQASASFGNSTATAGDINGDGYSDLVIGAFQYDNGNTDEGAAFLYYGVASGLSGLSLFLQANQASASFGISVSTAGDVNGDGYSDVVVGAEDYDNGETNEGAAFLYYGSASGLNATPLILEFNQASAFFGSSTAAAGDVNGDGYADVVVGAPGYDNGELSEGAAFVYYGSSTGLNTTPLVLESNKATGFFGISVASAGDVNGDGYSDVIVGAWLYDNGESDEGAAYLFYGASSGLGTTPLILEGNQADARFGSSVATAGDVNGDGYSDIIVGAWLYDNGESDEGAAFLFYGSPSGLNTTPLVLDSNQIAATLGLSVSTAGDVNGDGYSDLLVGAVNYDNGEDGEGAAFLYYGSALGLNSSPLQLEANQSTAWFGKVASAGDVNGDGYSDVIIGAALYDNGETNEGASFLYLGSASGLSTTPQLMESNQADALYGSSVATVGDVNGDGYSDVMIGAYLYDTGETDEGAAFLYYGGGGRGPVLRPQQLQGDGTTPINLLGRTASEFFRITAMGRTPFGRADVKLEWEVKPLGALLDGSQTSFAINWVDSGVSGATLVGLPFLSLTGPYHWRARLRYDPVITPWMPATRWITIQGNGPQESDLRVLACTPPDEPIWIYSVTLSVPQNFPILHFQDPNQTYQRTGWNVRRTNNPALPKSGWPLIATNIVDMDQGTPNLQWTDTTGDDPGPGNAWHYQVTAYNSNCAAEGPF